MWPVGFNWVPAVDRLKVPAWLWQPKPFAVCLGPPQTRLCLLLPFLLSSFPKWPAWMSTPTCSAPSLAPPPKLAFRVSPVGLSRPVTCNGAELRLLCPETVTGRPVAQR